MEEETLTEQQREWYRQWQRERQKRIEAASTYLRLQRDYMAVAMNNKTTVDFCQLWRGWAKVSPDEDEDNMRRIGEALMRKTRQQARQQQQSPLYRWENMRVLNRALMNRPSSETLNNMELLLSSRLGGDRESNAQAYNRFVRALRYVSSGTYGTVYTGTIGGPELDMNILRGIEESLDTADRTGKPPNAEPIIAAAIEDTHYIIKTNKGKDGIIDYTGSWAREVAIEEEVSEVNNKIHVVPRLYGISTCSGGPSLTSQYPTDTPLSTCKNDTMLPPVEYIYQEYVRGLTLEDALEDLSIEELHAVLLVIHSALGYMHKKMGFVHCDLNKSNIILRRNANGDPFDIPILTEGGNVEYYIRLNYMPTFIDFGMSVTTNLPGWGILASPYVTPFSDVVMLYDGLLGQYPDLVDVSPVFERYQATMTYIFGDRSKSRSNVKSKTKSEKRCFLAPVGITIDELTHKTMVGLLGDLVSDMIVKEPVYTMTQDAKLVPMTNDEIKNLQQREEEVNVLARMLSTRVEGRSDYLSLAIKDYLKQMY